jgi:hypothetical protein
MADIVCESCGERVVAGTQFCTTCGSYLGWDESESTDDTQQEAHTVPTRARPAPVQATAVQPVGEFVARTSDTPAAGDTVSPRVAAAAPVRTRSRSGIPCGRCGTSNEASRRFCGKCGLFIGEPSAGDQLRADAVDRRPWWQRWLRPRPGSERAARAAYRRSLPWPVRLRRVLIALVVVVLALAYLRFVGRDPLSWGRHVLADWRGTVVAVDGVTSAPVTQSAAVPNFPAQAATDKNSASAWATAFIGPTAPASATCSTAAVPGALLLTAPEQITMRAIMIQTGLTTPDRTQQWVPRALDLTFSDGTCQRITVNNVLDPQIVRIHAVKTNAVRLVVIAADRPQGTGGLPLAAITETALLVRPN